MSDPNIERMDKATQTLEIVMNDLWEVINNSDAVTGMVARSISKGLRDVISDCAELAAAMEGRVACN